MAREHPTFRYETNSAHHRDFDCRWDRSRLWFWHDRDQAASADRLVLFGNVDIRQVQLAFNDSERIARY